MGTGDTANEYGALLASYEGSGFLKLNEGDEAPCTFMAMSFS